MSRITFFILFLLVGFSGAAFAQEPRIIKFPQVEEWMNSDNDTLYVLNFWATWCRPCVAEMPHFDQVHQEYKNRKVKVIFISMDFTNEYESKLVPFVEKKGFETEIVLLDEPKYHLWIDKVSEEWSGAIPATLFSLKGVHHFHEGEYSYEELKSEIENLLK